MRKTLLRLVVVAGFVATIGQVGFPSLAQAINPADFNPGRIIDDELFYKKDDMSVGEIQAFLNAHVPACDTWGTGPSGYGNLTRAQYAQQIMGWHGPPYTCLNNYHENPDTGATSFENGGGAFAGGISAAQIIYNAAQQYGINPKVLLVTLRKEALNIYGDSWPLKSQYRYAMGYACPDSGPNYSAACVDSKSGFYKQITLAAWQFRYYYDNMGTYNFAPGRWNTIQYNPQPSCGTKDVYIQNYATASLYIYTPYTPNDAALNAYPGTAPCGAYGNRNFWFMWQEWFGSTYSGASVTRSLDVRSSIPNGRVYANDYLEASFVVRNDSRQVVNLGSITVACRDSSGANCDFPPQQVTLQPGQSHEYKARISPSSEGEYSFWITSNSKGYWDDNSPGQSGPYIVRNISNLLVQNSPQLQTGIVDDGDLRVGKTSTVSFTALNRSGYALDTGKLAVGMRAPSGRNADLSPARYNVAAGNQFTYSAPFTPQEVGDYSAYIINTYDNYQWADASFPVPTATTAARAVLKVKDNPTITSNVTFNKSDLRQGDVVTGNVKVKNFSNNPTSLGYMAIAMRDPDNQNSDLSGKTIGKLEGGSESIVSGTRQLNKVGTYTAWPIHNSGGQWSDSIPVLEDSSQPRKVSVNVRPNVTLVQGLTLSNSSPYAGEVVNGSFAIKNFSNTATTVNKNICMIVRGTGGNNDFGCMYVSTLDPGQTLTFYKSRAIGSAGDYEAYFSMFDGSWHDRWSFPAEAGNEPKSFKFTVKSNPVLSKGLTVDTGVLYDGIPIEGSFGVTNKSSTAVAVHKKLCFIVRPVSWAGNNDFGCMNIGDVAPGQTINFANKQTLSAGEYVGYLSMFDGESWHDNWSFNPDTGSEQKNIRFTVKSNPVLSQGIAVDSNALVVGGQVTASFKIKNMDTSRSALSYKKFCLIARTPTNTNFDFGCIDPTILTPGQEVTFSRTKKLPMAGTYKLYFAMLDGVWYDGWSFSGLTGNEPMNTTFVVK